MLNTSGTLKRQNIIKARHQVKLVKEQVCRDMPGQECKIELVNCDHDGEYGGGGDGNSDGHDFNDDGGHGTHVTIWSPCGHHVVTK